MLARSKPKFEIYLHDVEYTFLIKCLMLVVLVPQRTYAFGGSNLPNNNEAGGIALSFLICLLSPPLVWMVKLFLAEDIGFLFCQLGSNLGCDHCRLNENGFNYDKKFTIKLQEAGKYLLLTCQKYSLALIPNKETW